MCTFLILWVWFWCYRVCKTQRVQSTGHGFTQNNFSASIILFRYSNFNDIGGHVPMTPVNEKHTRRIFPFTWISPKLQDILKLIWISFLFVYIRRDRKKMGIVPNFTYTIRIFHYSLNIRGKRENESSGTSGTVGISTSCDLEDSDLDILKEKRTQKYIMLMTTAFATCLCPLMILR